MKTTCPVCGEELNVKEYIDDFTLTEQYVDCPNDHYYYEFAYGNEITKVGNVTVYTSWTDSEEVGEVLSYTVKEAIKHERERWENAKRSEQVRENG